MWGPRVGEIYAHILDAFVSNNKTHMSRYPPYPCDMKDIKQKLAAATNELIGEGKRFRSARELAQRAHTLGLVPNADSFSRAVARVIKAEHDTGGSEHAAVLGGGSSSFFGGTAISRSMMIACKRPT